MDELLLSMSKVPKRTHNFEWSEQQELQDYLDEFDIKDIIDINTGKVAYEYSEKAENLY